MHGWYGENIPPKKSRFPEALRFQVLLPTLRSWAVQASWNEWCTARKRRWLAGKSPFLIGDTSSNGLFCPLAFVSFQGTVSFRTLSHVSFFDRRDVMKCWSSKSSLLVLFISMEGGKFERQVASSKLTLRNKKMRFLNKSVYSRFL